MYLLIMNNITIKFDTLNELSEYLETNNIFNNIEIRRVKKEKVRKLNDKKRIVSQN